MKTTILFVLSIFCIVTILFAGCTDNANERAVTTTTVPTSPLEKYSAGDVIAKDSSYGTSAIAILKYNNVHDSYEIYDVIRSDGGSWQSQTSSSTRTLARSAVEKLYPAKIGSGVSSQPTVIITAKPVSGVTSQLPTPTPQIIYVTVLVTSTPTPEKAQETVYTGVVQATSNIQMIGQVYGLASVPTDGINEIRFSMSLNPGSPHVDLTNMNIVFSTPSTTPVIFKYGSSATTSTFLSQVEGTGSPVPSLTEQQQIQISFKFPPVQKNVVMNVEIRPSVGAVLSFSKTTPPTITGTNVLY